MLLLINKSLKSFIKRKPVFKISTSYKTEQKVNCSAKSLLKTVWEVENYKNFLPYCSQSKILTERENQFSAELQINFKFHSISYISNVTLTKLNSHYIVEQQSGGQVFNFLKGQWRIYEIDQNNCSFEYHIEFEFKNIVLQYACNLFLNLVGEQMVKSFTKQSQYNHKIQIIQYNLKKNLKQDIINQDNLSNFKLQVQQKESYNIQNIEINQQDNLCQKIFQKLEAYKINNQLSQNELNQISNLLKSDYSIQIQQAFKFYFCQDIQNQNLKFISYLKDLLNQNLSQQ